MKESDVLEIFIIRLEILILPLKIAHNILEIYRGECLEEDKKVLGTYPGRLPIMNM